MCVEDVISKQRIGSKLCSYDEGIEQMKHQEPALCTQDTKNDGRGYSL